MVNHKKQTKNTPIEHLTHVSTCQKEQQISITVSIPRYKLPIWWSNGFLLNASEYDGPNKNTSNSHPRPLNIQTTFGSFWSLCDSLFREIGGLQPKAVFLFQCSLVSSFSELPCLIIVSFLAKFHFCRTFRFGVGTGMFVNVWDLHSLQVEK